MFTGIIETVGIVKNISSEGTNLVFEIESGISSSLTLGQSVSHNGVCLTIIRTGSNSHCVAAVEETIQRTNFGSLKKGSRINLERSMQFNGRLDGHLVQGHVDTVAICIHAESMNGSFKFTFSHPVAPDYISISKGSIAVNGVSLTVVDSSRESFSVSVIPYTYENTIFNELKISDPVNVEFDLIGKYVARILETINS